jgi:hypothetical protein
LCGRSIEKEKKSRTLKFKTNKLVALVAKKLELQKKYHEAKLERDKELYERQIKIVDTHRLVYDLYELTEEECGIVEGQG